VLQSFVSNKDGGERDKYFISTVGY